MNDSRYSLWKEPCHVYWHDSDKTGRMSFAAISRYLQETAWKHAEFMGFGYKKASQLNQFWVLVRQLIRMKRFPVWGEEILIETWPREVDGLWAYRDYYIKDSNGEILGGVSSSWMIMNIKSRKPRKPDLVMDALPYLDSRMALGESAGKIIFNGNGKLIDSRMVRYSDMDMHDHVNNARYAEWVMDALSAENAMKNFTDFHINFISETGEGDQIELYEKNDGSSTAVKAICKSSGKSIFIAELSNSPSGNFPEPK